MTAAIVRGIARALDKHDLSRAEMAEIVSVLERSYPEVLTYNADGAARRTPKGHAPSLAPAKLEAMLRRVVAEIRQQGRDIAEPLSKGNTKAMSLSAKAWRRRRGSPASRHCPAGHGSAA